jgi:hypothetical protein
MVSRPNYRIARRKGAPRGVRKKAVTVNNLRRRQRRYDTFRHNGIPNNCKRYLLRLAGNRQLLLDSLQFQAVRNVIDYC